jgi:hypothetical protein
MYSKYTIPIVRQLHTFLSGLIEKWKPDLIVVLERKGTAVLRALIEWEEDPLNWSWRDVISSQVIDQVTNQFFKSKRILVFDEMMRTGKHIREFLDVFRERKLWKPGDENLLIAAFAVHKENSEHDEAYGQLPHAWFYRNLTWRGFQSIRMQIVKELQDAGSLLLDTEHIEVRFRLLGNFERFINVLRRTAKAVVYRKIQVVLDTAKSVKVSTLEELHSEILSRKQPNFLTRRYDRERDTFATDISNRVIRRTLSTCVVLGLIGPDGRLTKEGRQALRSVRFDSVVANQVRSFLRREGIIFSDINKVILEDLHSNPPVLPTSRELWETVDADISYSNFSRMLTLLVQCGGAESSQRKIYLHISPK